MNESQNLIALLADALAPRVAERLAQLSPSLAANGAAHYIDQKASPLGRKRHCAAVRRRMGEGKPGASVIGRRHLLTRDALAEELAAFAAEKAPRRPQVERDDIAAELDAELAELRRPQQ